MYIRLNALLESKFIKKSRWLRFVSDAIIYAVIIYAVVIYAVILVDRADVARALYQNTAPSENSRVLFTKIDQPRINVSAMR